MSYVALRTNCDTDSDGLNDGFSLMPFQQSFDNESFSSTFEDSLPFQTPVPFASYLENDATDLHSDAAPPDLDNKLLGFGAPVHKIPILDQNGQTWPRLAAELNGMFCVAEDVFEGDSVDRPLELTCYRRNLFQISGSITISRGASSVLLDQTRQLGIYQLSASLSATETIDGKAAEIICVPWKSGAANGAPVAEEKGGSAPISIPLDLSSDEEGDPLYVNIPISWGRLQFKVATANNGRRKGLQQHYRIHIGLEAKIEDGQVVRIAEMQSNPIVVRGRSPKNFDSSKDVPLSEKRAESRMRNSSSGSASVPSWIEPALQSSSGGKFYSQHVVQVGKQSFERSTKADRNSSLPKWKVQHGFHLHPQRRALREHRQPQSSGLQYQDGAIVIADLQRKITI